MKKMLISSLGVVAALSVSTGAVHATQTQSQEFSQSSNQKINFECQGNPCVINLENNASQNGKQSQSQDAPTIEYRDVVYQEPVRYVRPTKTTKTTKAKPTKRVVNTVWVNTVEDNQPTDGSVRINWGMRGGTCYVRYGETTTNGYSYSTNTGCDNGGITIGGLVPGRTYRFQVSTNRSNWSREMTIVAR